MLKKDLQYSYPEELVATERSGTPRVLVIRGCRNSEIRLTETNVPDLLAQIPAGDVLVINETQVLKRRVFTDQAEILFLSEVEPKIWQVLFPAKNCKLGDQIPLPGGARAELLQKGRPQLLKVDRVLDFSYFQKFGEMPLPPYIQKARGERHQRELDEKSYQTEWAINPGSLAAPTASLHFSKQQIQDLEARGVLVKRLTLHVGLGTFLPVLTENLNDHEMHSEPVEIPLETWTTVQNARKSGAGVWAMGTTVARSLEAAARGHFQVLETALVGETQLFLKPGSEWLVVNRLLTNFHQPESTLLALVASFSDLEHVRHAYQFAIEKKFRLYIYGDLTAWIP